MNKLIFAALVVTMPQFCRADAKPDVKYSDLAPATTATIHRNKIVLHLGSDTENSACYTKVKTKITGKTISVTGHRTLLKQSREVEVPLIGSADAGKITIEWINPNGSITIVPIKK